MIAKIGDKIKYIEHNSNDLTKNKIYICTDVLDRRYVRNNDRELFYEVRNDVNGKVNKYSYKFVIITNNCLPEELFTL